MGEEIDEDIEETEAYYDNHFDEDVDDNPEERSIQEMRREEMRKSVFEKDEKRLNEFLNQRKVSELEHALKSKDK